jgi:transposase
MSAAGESIRITAWKLSRAWKNGELVLVATSGHSSGDPGLSECTAQEEKWRPLITAFSEEVEVARSPEKSQIQALDRLLIKPGKAGTMTHDYLRNGITTLFAAFNVLDDTVLGRCMQRHRHQEFLRFLNAIERAMPAGKVIHVILDNSGSHKHPKVMAWLARHPRWTFHFTPTSGSWLNAVETFFSTLTRRRLKLGTFHSVVDLQAAIDRYIDEHHDDPKPFTWTTTSAQILAKLNPLNVSVH